MPSAQLPKHAQVLVIGGGPGGSYTASALAREGFDVVLFEAAKFPRYHIGESLLPSVRHFLRFIDAEDKVIKHGFARKPGAALKFNQHQHEGYTDFVALGADNGSWNVVRSEFDHLLLQHAAECGAQVYEQTRVTEIQFEEATPGSPLGSPRAVESALNGSPNSDTLGRPKSVSYVTAFGGTGEISFDYLVDAGGRAGLMSTKYLKNRKFNASLKNVAIWGYWKDTGMYGRGTTRENAPYFEALTDESGWAWFIPLHKGVTSVGIVMDQKQLGIRSRAMSSAGGLNDASRDIPSARTSSTLAQRYLAFLELAPGLLDLIGKGELVSLRTDEDVDDDAEIPLARSASDYSYSASQYAGAGWRLVGDAGAFIDPFFSSGVHLAMTGGLSAAASIAASIRGDCPEADAAAWYSNRVSLSYTRFMIVVLSAYKQIRSQSEGILADVDEVNFDKALSFIRPVIQGGADMGARLSEDEVQRALDFCAHIFEPTTPEQHESVRRKLEQAGGHATAPAAPTDAPAPDADPLRRLLDVRAPLVGQAQLDQLVREQLHPQGPLASPAGAPGAPDAMTQQQQDEVSMVLNKVNARRVIHAEHGNGINSLEEEELAGYTLRLGRGQLGLRRAEVSKDEGTPS